jgi:hypothetical protein
VLQDKAQGGLAGAHNDLAAEGICSTHGITNPDASKQQQQQQQQQPQQLQQLLLDRLHEVQGCEVADSPLKDACKEVLLVAGPPESEMSNSHQQSAAFSRSTPCAVVEAANELLRDKAALEQLKAEQVLHSEESRVASSRGQLCFALMLYWVVVLQPIDKEGPGIRGPRPGKRCSWLPAC